MVDKHAARRPSDPAASLATAVVNLLYAVQAPELPTPDKGGSLSFNNLSPTLEFPPDK